LAGVRGGDPLLVTATTLRDQTSFVYRFDAAQEGAYWLARQLCEQWLRDRHVRSDAVADLLVVVTELCAAGSGALVLRAAVDGDGVAVTVESAPVSVVPEEDVIHPHGDLHLAAALCDEIVLRVTPERTTTTARRHCVVLPD
jgi:hypothetical protein